jgi:DNA repair protein RecO (recombination protein O)
MLLPGTASPTDHDAQRHNGYVRLTRDEAIVLRTQKLGESDRIITLLTRSSGRVRAVGRGVRRTTSKFGSRLEPFMHVDVQIAAGHSLDVVAQVETLSAFAKPIGSDYARYTAGTAMLETAERLVAEEGEPAVQHFILLLSGLRALAEGAHEPTLVLDSFLLRALAVSGYAPSFAICARCGAEGPHRNFSAGAGGMLCNDCRLPGSARPPVEVVRLLGALLAGDWVTAESTELRFRKPASGIVAAYLQWHLERNLRSLPFVEREPFERGAEPHPVTG